MATYYVRPDGNDANTGLGSSAGQAWLTITKAMGATGISSGDTVYVAPGTYRSATGFTIATNYSSATQMLADPTAAQFSGVTAGPVRLSVYTPTDVSAGTTATVLGGTTNNLTISDFEIQAYTGFGISITGSVGIVIQRCVFVGATGLLRSAINIVSTSGNTLGTANRITRNIVFGFQNGINVFHNTNDGLTGYYVLVQNNFVSGCRRYGLSFSNVASVTGGLVYGTHIVTNNFIFNCFDTGIVDNAINNAALVAITCANNIIANCNYATDAYNGVAGTTQVNSRIINCSINGSYPLGATNQTTGILGLDVGQAYLHNLTSLQFGSSTAGSPNAGFGTATNALATDLYNVTWTGATPDAGAITYKSLATLTPTYQPTDRQASAITIAPGSTSQSIEVYLGVTGLTFATSGLAAYYVRNQAAPVAITLVTQTPTGAWSSGGFAEISSSLVPGVYRLDVPNAAFAAGASDVTIVVRGASGTNGAVLTVTLSSGGLTAAQTASAVLDAVGSSYVTAGSIGYAIQNSNVASISGSTSAADELEGALLHNGTDYISAELVTPVTSAALVRMGPFEVRADGLGASDPLDIQKGAQHGIDIQCVDNNGAGIDITSATVTAKVYNSGATLVDTYSCTATYAADGRATFTIDTTVTNVPGTYTATITRSTTANDTQVFGPLRIYVRDI